MGRGTGYAGVVTTGAASGCCFGVLSTSTLEIAASSDGSGALAGAGVGAGAEAGAETGADGSAGAGLGAFSGAGAG